MNASILHKTFATPHPARAAAARGAEGSAERTARVVGQASPASRRRFLMTAAASLLISPSLLRHVSASSDTTNDAADELPAEVAGELRQRWDGARQIVLAYKQGAELGEACRQLDAAQADLPVKILWTPPPRWVQKFPTIHFEKSNLKWEYLAGWTTAERFVHHYESFNPPEKSKDSLSPYLPFLKVFWGPKWSWPGRITDHLLDPDGPHRFSEYELRGLSVRQKKQLHTAHHQMLLEPGKKAPAWPPSHQV